MAAARYALVGDPIASSPSPAMHNAAFAALGIEATYELRPTGVDGAPAVVDALLGGALRGVNVTTPLKTVLAPAVALRGWAARARAVNTIWRERGTLVGALTDVEGVAEPVSELGIAAGAEALVVGSGGAARAAALALELLRARVHVAARRPDEASRLCRELGLEAGERLALDDTGALEQLFPRLAVVVQATPAGRAGESLALPWEGAAPGLIAFEMLYRPRTTPFLAAARARGARVVEGWQMLLAQGARSFELWTGRAAPRQPMRDALLAALASRL